MHRGYIALWRKKDDHPFYKEPREFSKYEAWIDILKEAQHNKEPQKVVLGMTILECNYGECLKSNRTWAYKWNWSESKVRRFLKLLKNMGQITVKGEGKTTRIKVINYEHYDPRRRTTGGEATNEQRTCDAQTATDNNVKNVKDDKKGTNNSPDNPKTWKNDFETYLAQCKRTCQNLANDVQWIADQEEVNPGVDILLTMKKAYQNYWGTEYAWKEKRKKKIKNINWKSTWQNALSQKMNRVYKDAVAKANQSSGSKTPTPTTYAQCQDAEQRNKIETIRRLREETNGRSKTDTDETNGARPGLPNQKAIIGP